MAPQALLGAVPDATSTHFRVWAPQHTSMDVVTERDGVAHPLQKTPDGYFTGKVAGLGAGTTYKYRLDGKAAFPDPASRYQPEGVHGPSMVVDPGQFAWSDAGWSGHSRDALVFYELHVGTFCPEGTFDGVTRRLEWLRNLGVTAIELMPVADFPGDRNWGYDGVSLFAPARCYGTPRDLQRLVDTAHTLGLSVFLDVVYNHFGPDGNYTGVYSPFYVSKAYRSPWGDGLNFDQLENEHVRELFIQNALYWLRDFHFDGLRLDATHAINDNSSSPFLAELAARVRAELPGRRRWLIAEDHRNLASMVLPPAERGLGLDGIWADDFHHEVRSLLAGDNDGYYSDYRGTTEDLASILNRGWLFCGEHSSHLGHARGTDPAGLEPSQFVLCIQNHDQIGNRAFGERLNHQITPAAYRVASAVLLVAPQAPLLFMGQEWSASAPFRFFTDHNDELGKAVTAGRREEFRSFKTFSDPVAREAIPDPQARATFDSSRLQWDELEQPDHAGMLRLYTTLLHMRQMEPGLRPMSRRGHLAVALDEATLALRLDARDGAALLVVVRLVGAGQFQADDRSLFQAPGGTWFPVLHTEEERFTPEPHPPRIEVMASGPRIEFAGPAAVLFRSLAPA